MGLTAAAATFAFAGRRHRRRPDPYEPDGLTVPDGRAGVVSTADGAEIAPHEAGPDDGSVVVLVHCWTGAKELGRSPAGSCAWGTG